KSIKSCNFAAIRRLGQLMPPPTNDLRRPLYERISYHVLIPIGHALCAPRSGRLADCERLAVSGAWPCETAWISAWRGARPARAIEPVRRCCRHRACDRCVDGGRPVHTPCGVACVRRNGGSLLVGARAARLLPC